VELESLSLGPIWLFEPLPDAAQHLKTLTGHDPRVTIVEAALGAAEATARFYVASNAGQSSSLLRPTLHLDHAPSVKFDESIEVDVLTVDNVFSGLPIPNTWIIDTQGSELAVLQGAWCSLHDVDYLYTEVNRAETYDG
jgi:FkbM family methyltransferase